MSSEVTDFIAFVNGFVMDVGICSTTITIRAAQTPNMKMIIRVVFDISTTLQCYLGKRVFKFKSIVVLGNLQFV